MYSWRYLVERCLNCALYRSSLQRLLFEKLEIRSEVAVWLVDRTKMADGDDDDGDVGLFRGDLLLLPSTSSYVVYSPVVCCVYLAMSTGLWFMACHILPVEKAVLWLLPLEVNSILHKEVESARCRLRNPPSNSERRSSERMDGNLHCEEEKLHPAIKKDDEENFSRRRTPQTSNDDIALLIAIRNRSAGFIHGTVSTLLALYCVCWDPTLKQDPIHGISPSWTLTGFRLRLMIWKPYYCGHQARETRFYCKIKTWFWCPLSL